MVSDGGAMARRGVVTVPTEREIDVSPTRRERSYGKRMEPGVAEERMRNVTRATAVSPEGRPSFVLPPIFIRRLESRLIVRREAEWRGDNNSTLRASSRAGS